MPRMVVVANLAAGAPCEDDARRKAVEDAFAAWNRKPDLRCVPGHELQQACADAIRDGADVIVAAGGDGTVSAAASAVAGSDAALAVLPMGTLNHFAKDAGIPLDLKEAAKVALQGRLDTVDIAQVNGRLFVNNANIGLYPATVRERDRHPVTWKRLATVRAAGKVLRQVPAHRLRLSIDGRPAVRTTSFLFVGNNAYETTSLVDLGSRASLTAGQLSVYTSRRPGRRALLGLAARALVGRLDQARDFEAHAARELVVDCHRPRLRAALDGELCTLETPLRFTTRPRALRLMRAPASGRRAA